MRPALLATTLLTAVMAAAPAAPAAAKGLVGLSVCGARGCVDRSALLGGGSQRDRLHDPVGFLDPGLTVNDPGRAPFVRLKLHIGEPGVKRSMGTSTIVYLPGRRLTRIDDGTWRRPDGAAAKLYRRAAKGVAPLPARSLKPFEPTGPPVPEVAPPHPSAPAAAAHTDGGIPAGVIGGAAAALALAGLAAFALTRRGRPATG